MTASRYILAFLVSAFFSLFSYTVAQSTRSLDKILSYSASTKDLKSNHIPDSVFRMKNLRSLSITGMDCDTGLHDDSKPDDGINCWMISEVSSEIKNLILLDTLDISLATFTKLPDEISTLRNLKVLILTDDNINNIDNLLPLINLTHLFLDGCRLQKLPKNIGNLKNLKYLGLVNNNLEEAEIRRIKDALPNCEVHYK